MALGAGSMATHDNEVNIGIWSAQPDGTNKPIPELSAVLPMVLMLMRL